MINRLVVNGCSYMNYYDQGGGTADLAQQLNMNTHLSLAKNSVCNARIFRTTLRDIYSAVEPTLYVIGITFVFRFELTVLNQSGEDGRWVSFNTNNRTPWVAENFHNQVSEKNLADYVRSWHMIMKTDDLFEDLVYRVCSLVDTAKNLGHKILVMNTAEHIVDFVDYSKYHMLNDKKEIVDRLMWRSIPWQFEQGASWPPEDEVYPDNCRHVRPGDHQWLNKFLIDYIDQNNITK
jgi:hypothetical protein